MKVIGLAGGIGAGKSAVARALAELGCAVSDSDSEGKAALERDEVRSQLRAWWGDGIFDANGAVDRKALASVVFAEPEARKKLEGLTHPLIHEARRVKMVEAAAAGAVAFVIDAPLLFEAGLHEACDAVLFVDVPRAVRLERVLARGWDEAELARREAAQWPVERKRDASDEVIDNSGPIEDLKGRVAAALERVLAL